MAYINPVSHAFIHIQNDDDFLPYRGGGDGEGTANLQGSLL